MDVIYDAEFFSSGYIPVRESTHFWIYELAEGLFFRRAKSDLIYTGRLCGTGVDFLRARKGGRIKKLGRVSTSSGRMYVCVCAGSGQLICQEITKQVTGCTRDPRGEMRFLNQFIRN